MNEAADRLRKARDFLVAHREDRHHAVENFRWPRFEKFNFALDWIDTIGASRDREALRIVGDNGDVEHLSYHMLSMASSRAANFLRANGMRRGDVVLVMLDNVSPLWITMLAAMKLGAVIVPCTPLLSPGDLADRVSRGRARFVIAASEFIDRFERVAGITGIAVGAAVPGWHDFDAAESYPAVFTPDGDTLASDPLLLYFTSGTTALPKLVRHSHVSYPVGHLSTMYWIGLKPGDVHLNISSPGWAKHAWSSVFAPWLAEATVMVLNQDRFDPVGALDALVREKVTTFCAPPTVWRMLVQQRLSDWRPALREVVGAGEPLNAEIIDTVRSAWGVTIRDGFGQTESSAMIGNSPGEKVVPGKVGRPLPGFSIRLRDGAGAETDEGEICVDLEPERPVGVMQGYAGEGGLTPIVGAFYRTGDIAQVDSDGRYTYVGRADDVFKASDYRISPFELESVLIEHPAVMEAAVVPSPDPTRLAVPKAFVALAPGHSPTAETAHAILDFARERLGPFKRLRRIRMDRTEIEQSIGGLVAPAPQLAPHSRRWVRAQQRPGP